MPDSVAQSSTGIARLLGPAPLTLKAYFGFAIVVTVFKIVSFRDENPVLLAGWSTLPYVLSTIGLLVGMSGHELLKLARLVLVVGITWGLVGVAILIYSRDFSGPLTPSWLDWASIIVACIWLVVLSTQPVKSWSTKSRWLPNSDSSE